MEPKERRKVILNYLIKRDTPYKGHELAEKLGVTRQVIVKDIAMLRAAGKEIIATPEGYLFSKDESTMISKVIAVSHSKEHIEDELNCIVKFGGIIKDVIIEHPLYGEIRAMIMIKSLYDIQNFMIKFKELQAEPLLNLTNGVHLHTIEAENEEIMKQIINELEINKYIIFDN